MPRTPSAVQRSTLLRARRESESDRHAASCGYEGFLARSFVNAVSLRSDALQQNGSRFVVWILRNEFAAEGFGKDGLRKFLDVRRGLRVARFKLVGQHKQSLHSSHDFPLFSERRNGDS